MGGDQAGRATGAEARPRGDFSLASDSVDEKRKSADAILYDEYARVRVVGCNFTKPEVAWGAETPFTTAIVQVSTNSRTNFTLFGDCDGGSETFYRYTPDPATFGECVFLDCSPAISHRGPASGEDILERCFFAGTDLKGPEFREGSVLLRNCFFAGPVPGIPVSFSTDGEPQANTFTQLVFDTESQLDMCAFPAPTRKMTRGRVSPYSRGRRIISLGIFMMVFLLV